MRVKVTRTLYGHVDGVALDRFVVGDEHDVGVSLGCYLMAMDAIELVEIGSLSRATLEAAPARSSDAGSAGALAPAATRRLKPARYEF
jgi:hypothetical protein